MHTPLYKRFIHVKHISRETEQLRAKYMSPTERKSVVSMLHMCRSRASFIEISKDFKRSDALGLSVYMQWSENQCQKQHMVSLKEQNATCEDFV